MLQAIRERAQGWIAYAIVGMISIPFALWGVNSYFNEGGSYNVITINDREIGQSEFRYAYSNQRQSLQQLMGENFRPDLINEEQLLEQVIRGLIDNEVLVQNALARGFRVGDQQVAQIIQREQSFQRDSKFDRALFDVYLRNQGETADGFALRLKSALLRGQVEGGLSGSEFVDDAVLTRMHQLRNQTRDFEYLVIPTARFKDLAPNDEEVRRYYEENAPRFVTPHRVKVEYLELKLDAIANTMEPEESLLVQRYEAQLSRFGKPEDRQVSHILITVDDSRDDSTAKQKAVDLRKRILDGESFEELAKSESDDPGSSTQGGDLGFIGRGIMDPEFERAAYAMGLSDISEPVRTGFGYHLLKINAVKPGSTKSYEEVRNELLKEAQREMAENQFFEEAEILANASFENPDTLSIASEQLGLTIEQSDWFTRAGGDGIAGSPIVTTAAFSNEVLNAGNNSEPLEITSDHLVVLRVLEQQVPAQQELDDVRDSIVQSLKGDDAKKRAREMGQGVIDRLRSGESIGAIGEAEGLEVKNTDGATRESAEVPAALRQLVFRMAKPQKGSANWGGTVLANGDYAIVALRSVNSSELPVTDEEKVSLRQALLQAQGQETVRSSIDSLRAKADIRVNRDNF